MSALRGLSRFFSLARLILLVIVGGYFALLWAVGGHRHWDVLGVPPLRIPFGDVRAVTSAWECVRRGVDVMVSDPCDPYHRVSNYPGIWMAPSHLGLGAGDTVAIGLCLVAVFLVSAFVVLPSSARPFDAVVYGAAACSPAVMLGVDRGNVDILLFALVVLAVLLYRRGGKWPLGEAIVLFAAILKLFPIFAAGVFVRRRTKRNVVGVGVILIAFAVYCLAILHELKVIWRIPQPPDYSYGIRVCSEWLASRIGGATHLRVWDAGLAIAVLAAIFLVRGRLRATVASDDHAEQRDVDLFVAGAGIYVLTFLLFRSFEYRLVFLLLTIPHLLRWARASRMLAVTSLAFLLAALWFDLRPGENIFGFHTPVALVGFVQLGLFAVLACGLITTMNLQQPLSGRRTRSDARALRGNEG